MPFLHFLWCMAQRSLCAITKIYYGSYARLSWGSTWYHSNAKVSRDSTWYHDPSCIMWAWTNDHATSHSSEQGTLSTSSPISMQAIPYRTRGGTSCPGVSIPKIWTVVDSSMTNHITWQSPTISTIPSNSQITISNLTTVTSHHNGWKTSTLSTQPQAKTQHHKDGGLVRRLKTEWLSNTTHP
jgi:hypothetical protein